MAFGARKFFGTFDKQATEQDSNPDFCDTGTVFHQLIYQANWKLVTHCVGEARR